MRTLRIVKSMSSTSSHWMRNSYGFYRNRSRWSTVLWYGKCAYSGWNDINTEQLFFVSLKIKDKKKRKKKKKLELSAHTRSRPRYTWTVEVFSTTELCQHHMQVLEKINTLISINYKTSDSSAGSSLYEDFLWVICPLQNDCQWVYLVFVDVSDNRECLF